MEAELRKKVSLLNPVHFLGLGFGSGLIPFMPGTMGSLAAVPLLAALAYAPVYAFLVVTAVSVLMGIYICDRTAQDMGVHDHGSIVWDEIAGMLITLLFIPLTPFNLVLGFLLFRLFDILKPWPISFVDKHIHGGFGIMLDDVIAGIMACACLHLANLYWIL